MTYIKSYTEEKFEQVDVPPYFEKEMKAVHNETVVGSPSSSSSEEEQFRASILTNIEDESLSDEMKLIEKRLVKKLDYIYVMPCFCMLMMIQYFDKTTLNFSAVLGIKEDTHLKDGEFGWLGSIFFIGYLAFQIPNAYLVQKLPVQKYLSVLIVIWGTILALTSLSKNFTHLMIFRFLLGVFEAAVLPCCVIIINQIYRRGEQTLRLSVFFMASGVSISIGGLIAYGIGHMDGVLGMRAWRWMMIILGCITVIFGIICYFVLIGDALTIARSEQERAIIRLRMKDNAVVVSRKINFSQIREALTESRYYCFLLFLALFHLQHGALLTFSATITKGFGFSNLNAILLGVPTGLATIVCVVTVTVIQRKYKNSALYSASGMALLSTLGLVLLIVIPYPPAKLAGLYLCYSFVAAVVVVLGVVTSNVSGYTKKIFYNASFAFASTCGSFTGPQMMVPNQAPVYIGGMLGYILANLVCVVLLLTIRHMMSKLNRQKEKDREAMQYHDKNKYNNVDVTDRENVQFIYSL